MDKVLAIIRREYLTRVRSKGFIIGTILSPLLMASFVVIPALVMSRGERATHRLVVLDQTSETGLIERVREILTQAQAAAKKPDDKNAGDEKARPTTDRSDRYEVTIERISDERVEARKSELNSQFQTDNLTAYVVVPADVMAGGKVTYHAKNVSDFLVKGRVEDAFNKAIIERRMTTAGIDPAKVAELSREIRIDTINERGEREQGQSFILAYALLMIIYITILVYGIMVMRGVIEEKQSRIIEVLLSSVRPFQLMLGKLFGIGMVALTQYLTWTIFAFVISALAAAPMFALGSFRIPHIPTSILIFFVVFFLLGYFLYATLYLVVGAIVSSEEDGQQLQMPVTFSIVIPMALSSMVLRNPDGVFSTVMSLIPIFSPVLMFMRITIKQPPWWQIGLSIVLMTLTIFGIVWLAARIYRVGVLMYGKRPTLPELAKWLRYT